VIALEHFVVIISLMTLIGSLAVAALNWDAEE